MSALCPPTLARSVQPSGDRGECTPLGYTSLPHALEHLDVGLHLSSSIASCGPDIGTVENGNHPPPSVGVRVVHNDLTRRVEIPVGLVVGMW